MGRFFGIALLSLVTLTSQAAHTQARLLLAADAARPGDTVLAGIELRMAPDWHTYWQNPGPSGSATKVEWELPPGVTALPIQWPVPEKLPDPEFTTYIYKDQVVLLVPLKLATNLPPGPLVLKAKVSWLECAQSCILGDAPVEARLNVGSETKPSNDASLLASWEKRLPQTDPTLSPQAWWENAATGDLRPLVLEWNSPAASTNFEFFPNASEQYEVQGPTQTLPGQPGKSALRKQIKKTSGAWPERISGVLVQQVAGDRRGYAIDIPIQPNGAASGLAASTGTPPQLWKMLLYAFLGGLILNVMPCVLPVIALKILGFVNQAKDHPARVRALGLIYALGVLVSFLVLALLVIAAKAAGSAAGWGFQFGNPYFLVAMTTLVTLIALNLFGVFEVTLGGGTLTAASTLSSKHGASGAFFNGLLTTALATSCSAPYLGFAVGFAFSQGPALILLTMLTVGVGLAFPYVLLSWNPTWLRLLPRPGPWMEKFKIAMGFPMLGAAIWLCSLLDAHYRERVWWMAAFLVFVALAMWVYGEFVQRGTKRRLLAGLFAAALLVTGYFYALDSGLDLRSSGQRLTWETWSPQAVAEAQAAGRPVLVDFTARWCATCNILVKPVLESRAVQDKLKAVHAVSLLADYTDYSPEITAELRRLGQAGVPVVLVYSPHPEQSPKVFDAVTRSAVLDALDQASR